MSAPIEPLPDNAPRTPDVHKIVAKLNQVIERTNENTRRIESAAVIRVKL